MKDLLHEVTVEKVSKKIVNQIVDLIFEGKLVSGEKLPSESKLIEIFEVGRLSLREAIVQLEEMGYLDVRARGDVYVKPINSIFENENNLSDLQGDQRKIKLLFCIRKDLEVASAYTAAIKCSREHLSDIKKCFESFKFGRFESEKLWELDQEFHTSIVRASNNLFRIHEVINVFYFLQKNIKPVFERVQFYDDNFATVLSQHQSIVEAIVDGDADKAQKRMSDHIDWTNRYTLDR